jgi:hypothetical protein
VTDLIYDDFEEDSNIQSPYISAREIKVKLKSLQSIIQVTSDENAGNLDTKITDPDTICQQINEHALQAAVKLMPKERLNLYIDNGPEIVFEKDYVFNMMEPLWSQNVVKMELQENGKKLMVGSSAFVTSVNMEWKNITLMAGLHYCKLVSPARFVEWMYTDGLREKMGLNSK